MADNVIPFRRRGRNVVDLRSEYAKRKVELLFVPPHDDIKVEDGHPAPGAPRSDEKWWIVEYYADGEDVARDCYPDYCASREQAQEIAPQFMANLDWAVSWRIREFTVEEE